MAGILPTAVYGIEVPAGIELVPAQSGDFPGAFRITMAAIDPTAEPVHPAELPYDAPPRATLKLIRVPIDDDGYDSEDDDDEDEDGLMDLLNDDVSDESSEDDEANGGPSDPSKSKKAKREAGIRALKAALKNAGADDDEDDEMEDAAAVAAKLNKGKGIASEDDDDDDSEDIDEAELDEFVICTLDPTKNYQQPLDITVGENESVFFKVTGTHAVYLTGNYVMPLDDGESDEEDDEYDLEPDSDELYDMDDESDELDDVDDPRVTEIDSEEEEAPKLVTANGTSKKRGSQDLGLDEMIKADRKEKQKKQKNNAGDAVAAPKEDAKKGDKKVQFAKNLEQGPTPSGNKKADGKKADQKKEAAKSVPSTRTVNGVFVDDRKEGTGPAAKKGSKLGMRYIGKFNDGKVFDSNKKGKPFGFTLGAGEVIKGWDIGVEGMRVGGERRIKVPANLAYGSRPPPGIPKNAELTFDIKLVELR